MSVSKVTQPPSLSRQAEEQYLAETLAVIHDNIEKYGHDVAQMKAQINDMLEHFHDDNPELINQLENTITMHDHMKRALERNEKAQEKPYFGRIIFHDETLGKEESIYIGRGGISKDATHWMVVDWRAPVANAYYENGLGKCSYPSPAGGQLPIDLKAKRTYEIEDGRLKNYFDSEVIANDDLLTKYLAKNKQAILGEIVATIQKEQNEIIRKTPYHNVIVQGVAGSGKTTVAMHRISYILYNYAERFKPDDFYIVGSNRILLNYITGVLPDLDVYGVRQMTMEQLFVRLLYEDWDEKKYRIKSTDHNGQKGIAKGRLTWFRELEAYCNRLEWQTIPRESIYLNPKQFVEGWRDGKTGVFDESDKEPTDPNTLVLLMDGAAVERYIHKNPTISIQSKIDMLNERLDNKVKDEFLGKGVKYTVPEKKAIMKAYHGRYGAKTWKKSIFTLYQDFLQKQISKGYDVDIPSEEFDVYDLAALAYLYKRVKETEVISEAHHVVIDEAQDFGMMAYCVLKYCIKDCSYTIMGDVSQNIHFGYGLNDWEELRQLYLVDEKSSFGILKKSYRNTVEISEFATAILHHGQFFSYPVEPIIRHGNPVEVTKAKNKTDLIKKVVETCKQWQAKGLDTIAVICRNQEAATKTAKQLGQLIPIMESDLEKAEFGSGILVLPVEFTKGLEFDAVLIFDPTMEDYPVEDGHAKLLYVAATRALHELRVLHTGNLTGLIADPLPEKAPKIKPSAPIKAVTPKSEVTKSTLNTTYTAQSKPRISAAKTAQSTDIAQTARPAQSNGIKRVDKAAQSCPNPIQGFSYGDYPATEKLRPTGHPRIDASIRWITRQPDGLYLQSRYGILRISPVGSDIIRITFSRGTQITAGTHPKLAITRSHKEWMYKESPKAVDLMTDELRLQVDKTTSAISYLTRDRKPLLTERSKDPRQVDLSARGAMLSRLYFNWLKNETICALGPDGKPGTSLRGTARYIMHGEDTAELPFILSDNGYGILIASDGPTFCCDISNYGSYLYTENASQLDYYFIAGKSARTILSAYAYLCGKPW